MSISIVGNDMVVVLDWLARTPVGEDSSETGQPWYFYPSKIFSFGLVPSNQRKGYVSYTWVDSDGCIYFDLANSNDEHWMIVPNDLDEEPKLEDVIGDR
ncbi:MAG: hypothetical protein PVI21_05240 [Candidatus Woesebacteria bacterium]